MKSEQSTRIMSDFRCIAWENRSTSGFFHRYRCVLAFFGKRRTVCEACCDWKSLHCAGGIGQKNQLAPCHASGRNRHNYLGRRRPRNLSSRRLANPDAMPIPPWRKVGFTTSQSSRSCFRQKNLVNWVNIRTKVSVDSYVSEYSPKLFAGEGSDTISTI